MKTEKFPDNIETAPASFREFRIRINALLDFARAWNKAEGRGGVKITQSSGNVIISGSGGSVPSGYGPESFTICEDGAPTSRNFVTDNPD